MKLEIRKRANATTSWVIVTRKPTPIQNAPVASRTSRIPRTMGTNPASADSIDGMARSLDASRARKLYIFVPGFGSTRSFTSPPVGPRSGRRSSYTRSATLF